MMQLCRPKFPGIQIQNRAARQPEAQNQEPNSKSNRKEEVETSKRKAEQISRKRQRCTISINR